MAPLGELGKLNSCDVQSGHIIGLVLPRVLLDHVIQDLLGIHDNVSLIRPKPQPCTGSVEGGYVAEFEPLTVCEND